MTVNVTNRLNEDTSIHWHGILLPYYMDGVPMVSFAGIKPGKTFTYRFKVRQSGTYWYHSHSGGQEQEGMYAPIVIEPAKGERYKVDARLRGDALRPSSDVARRHPAQAQAGAGLLQRPQAHLARPDARPARRQDHRGAPGDHFRPAGLGRDAHGSDRSRRRHGLHLPGERPRAHRQLDRPVPARREGAAALHQRLGHDGVRCPHPRPEAQGRAGRRQRRGSRSMSTSSGSASARPTT